MTKKTFRTLALTLPGAFAATVPTLITPVIAQAPASYEQAVSAYEPAAVGELWSRTELYFGAERPDGSEVTESGFQTFMNLEITPRFPDGLTLLEGDGQWRDAQGVIEREASRVLILLYPTSSADANAKIEAVRAAYKRIFQQESVLRVDSLERVSS